MRNSGSVQLSSVQVCDVSHPALCVMDPTLVACSMETWISPLAAAGVGTVVMFYWQATMCWCIIGGAW